MLKGTIVCHSHIHQPVCMVHTVFLMVPGILFSVRLGVLPPPGFGGGGIAAGGEEGLDGAADLGCDFPSDDFPAPFSPFFCGVPFCCCPGFGGGTDWALGFPLPFGFLHVVWCINSICLRWW